MVLLVMAAAGIAATVVLVRLASPRPSSATWCCRGAQGLAGRERVHVGNIFFAGRGLGQLEPDPPVVSWVAVPVILFAVVSVVILIVWTASGLSAGDREVLPRRCSSRSRSSPTRCWRCGFDPAPVYLIPLVAVGCGSATMVAAVRTPVGRAPVPVAQT